MDWRILIIMFITVVTVYGQSPTVKITETEPMHRDNVINVERDQDVTMNCFVENKQKGTQIRWQRVSREAGGRIQVEKISVDTSVEDNTKSSIEKPTAFTWRLRLKSVQIPDSGNYSCFVYTTRQNRQEANMTVQVLVRPYLDEEKTSSDMIVKAGDNVDLICNATGIPKPTIEWSKLGGALLPIRKEKHFEPLLSIVHIEPRDRGKYRCKAYNEIGMVQRDISIDVKFRPEVRAVHRVLKQATGYLIELQCLVEANPFPAESQLKWVRGSRSVSLAGGRYKIQAIEGAFNQMIYELIIYQVRDRDYAEYTCQIENSEGTSSASITLQRTDEPQPSVKLGRIISGSSALYFSISTLIMGVAAYLMHRL